MENDNPDKRRALKAMTHTKTPIRHDSGTATANAAIPNEIAMNANATL